MSFVKAKIHVSVCKDYIDFYEGQRLKKIGKDFIKKKIKKNIINFSNKKICRCKTNEDINRNPPKSFDSYQKGNKNKFRNERKKLKRVIGIVSNGEKHKNNERKKITVSWKILNDGRSIVSKEKISKHQKKKILHENKRAKVQYRHLILNKKHYRKLYMHTMLKGKKVSYVKKNLKIKKRQIYKKGKNNDNSSCKNFNIITIVDKVKNKNQIITTCVNIETEEKENNETNNRKISQKEVTGTNEKSNVENKTECVLFSETKENNYQNKHKNSFIQDYTDIKKEKISELYQMEEESCVLEHVSEKEMKKKAKKSDIVLKYEKPMKEKIEIAKIYDETNEKNKNIETSKLENINNDECDNLKKHEEERRTNLKENKNIEYTNKDENKKIQEKKCTNSKNIKESNFKEMEISQIKNEEVIFEENKKLLQKKIVKEKVELKIQNDNKVESLEKKMEQKKVHYQGKEKKYGDKSKSEENHANHGKNNGRNSMYDFINIASDKMFNEGGFTIEGNTNKKNDCVYEKIERTRREKIDILEKNMTLKNVENVPSLKNRNADIVLINTTDNIIGTNNNIRENMSNIKHSSKIFMTKDIKQDEKTSIIENIEVSKNSEQVALSQIEKEKKTSENDFYILNETQDKMEKNDLCLFKEDNILKEIKRKEADEMIQLNIDSSFSSSKGAGLNNKGQNICFFNSIIQSITRTPYICKDLINKLHSMNCEKKKKKSFCFFCLFEQLACNIISNDNVTINNVLVPYIHKYVCSGYKIGYQEDVHEYLRYFLSSLEKCSIYSAVYIQKMFTGVTKNVTICVKCNNVSLKYEQYYELSLDISSTNNLEDALKNFLSKEMLKGENGYYCDKCKKKTVASKQCVINKLPRILTIQIKRFFMNSHYDIVKSHKAITYPLRLDMRYYINNYDKLENSLNKNIVTLYEKTFHQKDGTNKIDSVPTVDIKTCFNNNIKKESTSVYRYNIDCGRGKKKGTREKNSMGYNRNGWPNKIGSCIGNQKWHSTPILSKLKGGNNSKSICVLKEIENIFSDLPCEISQKRAKKKLSISDLRNIITEKKKLIFKYLSKVRFSKVYDDVYLKICKDLSKIYYSFKNNLENENSLLKTCLHKYRFDDSLIRLAMENTNVNEKNNSSLGNFNSKDLSREVYERNDVIKKKDTQNYFHFELTGLIKHIGSGTEYGHYVALTKSKNNYLECDDRNVTYIKEKDMLNCLKNAYVFVYTCINPHFIDFYNKYIDVFEKNNFDMNLPVFEKNVEFKERITMPKGVFIKSLLC